LAAALVICGPWVGWWTLLGLGAAGIVFMLTDRGLADSAHPEYRLTVAWLNSELAIAGSSVAGGLILASSVAGGLILASSLGVDPAAVVASPQRVVFPLALLGPGRCSRWL